MSDYCPDLWVILKVEAPSLEEPLYKVMGSWYGGFGGSNSWRVNSGIEKVIRKDNIYEIVGYSGSIYYCPVDAVGMSFYSSNVLADLQREAEAEGCKITVVDIKTLTID